MKKPILLAVLMSLIQISVFSQCLPDGITFTSQEQIDSFQMDYPDCSNIEGFVKITGSDITNLDSLINIMSIGEYLLIESCGSLTSLLGLSNIDSIGGWIAISSTSSLTNLQGLEGIEYLTYLELSYNWGLTSLQGLNNLDSIEGCLYFQHNGLIDFTGLENLKKINGCLDISWHSDLTSFSGMDNLEYIGDYFYLAGNLTSINSLSSLESIAGYLSISSTGLTSLEGLDNIAPSSITGLHIYDNGSLNNCNVESICNYLLSPNGTVNIYNNAEGCNSPPEIAAACGNSMPCLPFGNYYFLSQENINSFQSDYPDCSSLNGDVRIRGLEIDSLNGLIPIKSISRNLEIFETSDLTTLDGLDSLETIGHDLYIGGYDFWPISYPHNYHLSDISSLINLKNVSDVIVKYNFELQSLSGLDSIRDFSSIEIGENEMLTYCHVKSVCDFLAGSSSAEIYANDEGCNSEEEVEYLCLVGIEDKVIEPQFSIFPNPAQNKISISTNSEATISQLNIYNQLGQKVLHLVSPPNTIDISEIGKGLFVVEIVSESKKIRLKLVKE